MGLVVMMKDECILRLTGLRLYQDSAGLYRDCTEGPYVHINMYNIWRHVFQVVGVLGRL